MIARLSTGVVLGGAIIALLIMGPDWSGYAIIQLLMLFGADEFYRMGLQDSPKHYRLAGVLAFGGIIAVTYWASAWLPAAFLIATLALLCVVLFSSEPVEKMGPHASVLIAGLLYLGGTVAALTDITHMPNDDGYKLLLILFATVFFGDTGAFFFGKGIGGPKLYPKISPKKTWSGAIGGALCSVGGFFLFYHLFPLQNVQFTVIQGVGLALVCAVLAQIGDLAESLFKRSYGVKDSGSILPGHGGMLDRVDGVLFAAPAMWIWLTYIR
jgi:phosphatidate cytidylyltransferase